MQEKSALVGFTTQNGNTRYVPAAQIAVVTPDFATTKQTTVMVNPALTGSKMPAFQFAVAERPFEIARNMETAGTPLVTLPVQARTHPKQPDPYFTAGESLVNPRAIVSIEGGQHQPTLVQVDDGKDGLGLTTPLSSAAVADALSRTGTQVVAPTSFPPLEPSTVAKFGDAIKGRGAFKP